MRAETAAAIRAVQLAQQVADSREGAADISFKEGRDVVTAADMACEDAIRAELARAFPAIPVVGEERGGATPSDRPYWLVDPICGTRCYASDVPLYCANVALVEDGRVTAAAIGIGRSDEIVYAERGAGAYRLVPLPGTRSSHPSRRAGDVGIAGGPPPVQHAPPERLAASDASHVLWVGGRRQPIADVARRLWLADRWFLWTFTSTVAYAYLASGRIAGILHYQSPGKRHEPFHTAAGYLAVSEAGAVVMDLETGEPPTLATRDVLIAATPALHRELLDLVRAQ